MVEKNKKMVIIESPTFYDNDKELEEYIKSLNTKVEGILLAYHMSGANFLKGVKKYATQKADDYWKKNNVVESSKSSIAIDNAWVGYMYGNRDRVVATSNVIFDVVIYDNSTYYIFKSMFIIN